MSTKTMSPCLHNTFFFLSPKLKWHRSTCAQQLLAGFRFLSSVTFSKHHQQHLTSWKQDFMWKKYIYLALLSQYETHPSTPMFEDSSDHVCRMLLCSLSGWQSWAELTLSYLLLCLTYMWGNGMGWKSAQSSPVLLTNHWLSWHDSDEGLTPLWANILAKTGRKNSLFTGKDLVEPGAHGGAAICSEQLEVEGREKRT